MKHELNRGTEKQPQNCVVWAAQILCGNAILGFSVEFLEAAGFTSDQAFDVNIALSTCYIVSIIPSDPRKDGCRTFTYLIR